MGFCPYSRRLEAQMNDDMARLGPGKVPEIVVHYLLYWDEQGPVRRVGSTHGEKERVEDIVQILIRDEHPAMFWRYLALRSKAEEPWQVLAQKAGLGWTDIGRIERRVQRDGDTILTAEHEWNTRNFPYIVGSPSFFWRGYPVRSIAEVPGFTEPPEGGEKCSEGAAEE
jgi:hypothetical protein